MPRESPYFREIVQLISEQYGGKSNLNLTEYSAYLGKDIQWVRKRIEKGAFPGKKDGRDYVIPITSIALFEIKNQGG